MQIAIITTCGRLGSFVCHRAIQTRFTRHSQLFSKNPWFWNKCPLFSLKNPFHPTGELLVEIFILYGDIGSFSV